MKFFITAAFLSALSLGTVSSESHGEDEFWHRYAQELDSMVMTTDSPTSPPTSTPTITVTSSNVPTEKPTPDEVEVTDVPTETPTLGETSLVPSLGETSIFPSPTSSCAPIDTILCNVPEFSTVCELLNAAGLSASFNEDTYTIFAPINDAFDSLPEEIADALAEDDDLLRTAILYHAVPEMELLAEMLVCGGRVMMANQEETTTECTVEGVFQVGISNSPDDQPQIIARDGVACNGIIHAIDEVLLPSLDTPVDPTPAPTDGNETEVPSFGNETMVPSDECENLVDSICGLSQFEILCALIGDAGLVDALSGDDKFTIFAPVNSAFEALPVELADAVISDSSLLEFVLLTHAVPGELFGSDLECGGEISMVSTAETTTVCETDAVFQSGGGNSADSLPEIISVDGIACNGVVHAIDQVILPPSE